MKALSRFSSKLPPLLPGADLLGVTLHGIGKRLAGIRPSLHSDDRRLFYRSPLRRSRLGSERGRLALPIALDLSAPLARDFRM